MTTGENVKVTWELEIPDRASFKPVADGENALELKRLEVACPEFNWFLFQAVGRDHRWGGRGDWDEAKWIELVERDELQTWVGYVEGTPAGYAELEKQEDGAVRILCFGLLPRFIGQGLGARLLSDAVTRAWEMDADRVWLRTCNHDHPHALPNYQARGFRLVEETSADANPRLTSVLFTGGQPADSP